VNVVTRERGWPPQARLELVEALRGGAALYVFLHHFAHEFLVMEHPAISRLFVLGQAAVIVFFILSGFVIQLSTFAHGKSLTFRDYFLRRFRRIYPTFIAALALGYAAACVEAHSLVPLRGWDLLGNLLMLQDNKKAGTWFAPYWENSPLWSLSYEWFFYMAFFVVAVALELRPDRQKYAVLGLGIVGALIYLAIPNQISFFLIYFIIWWSGVELGREYSETGRITFGGQRVTFGLVAIMSLPFGLAVLKAFHAGESLSAYEHPLIEFRHFLTALALLALGLAWARVGFGRHGWATRRAAWFGKISYALYVFHRPMLSLLARFRITPWVAADFLLWVAPLTIVLAYIFEVKFQPRVNRLISV